MLPFPPHTLPAGFRDSLVLAAMERVPRERFLPPEQKGDAERDVALPIGCGQTISQPFIVAYMTAGLAVQPGARVLEIGTGSGYQAAVLATMGVEVYSVEVIPELSVRARAVLSELGLIGRVHLRVGDGWHGWPQEAPFDGVLCTAAPPRVPLALVEQLAVGARIVIPVGGKDSQTLRVLKRDPEGLEEIGHLAVRFVPLVRARAEG